ncbi:MAG: transcriptional regulator [Bacteroidetes bacterium GWE2_42_24]|nr:MAG: transcriptional regulator [Bacteroidetes bacterium GWE2_42_24]OFY32610.1 MAG: transcriptional regulator [Bacteroidetes bacterium GWF2_43_11]
MSDHTADSRRTYIGRINKAMDYIDQNIDQPLMLCDIASSAHFSPFHFHRIFSALTGETVNNYLKRIRIEKAASLLINNPDLSISEIALKCGFSSNPVFCRTFRDFYAESAQQFRKRYTSVNLNIGPAISKNHQSDGKNRQSFGEGAIYLCTVSNINDQEMQKNIQVKEMPVLNLVYCRHTGAFDKIGGAYEKLLKWAGPRGLLSNPFLKTVTVYHDDPKVTVIEKLRQSACITVEDDVKVSGEFGKLTVPAGKYAVGRFEIGVDGFERAWNDMCRWFVDSGYQPGEGCSYELYHNDHRQHPEHKFILDLCIPVTRL